MKILRYLSIVTKTGFNKRRTSFNTISFKILKETKLAGDGIYYNHLNVKILLKYP